MAGRPRKPLHILKMQGQYRKDRHGKREESQCEVPVSGPPDKPIGMSVAAAKLWDLIVKHRPDWLDATDGPALEATAGMLSGLQSAVRSLESATDVEMRLVLMSAIAKYSTALGPMLSKFGLTPMDRSKLVERLYDPTKKKAPAFSRQRG